MNSEVVATFINYYTSSPGSSSFFVRFKLSIESKFEKKVENQKESGDFLSGEKFENRRLLTKPRGLATLNRN